MPTWLRQRMNITVLDLSAYLGLVAVGAVTINMLLGGMMAFKPQPVRNRPSPLQLFSPP